MVRPTGTTALILWGTAAGMAFGTLAFLAMGRKATGGERAFYVISVFLATIASVSYFSMATGFGVIEVPVAGAPVTVYWARYAGWLFTTPLLLVALALLADADPVTAGALVGLDVAMVLSWFAGALSRASVAVRVAWWGIGSGFFLVLLYVLVGTLSEQAGRRTGDVATTFATLRNLLVLVWVGYPLVWILGTPSTLGVFPPTATVALFAVLDLLATVGFGYLLLRSHNVLERATTATPA